MAESPPPGRPSSSAMYVPAERRDPAFPDPFPADWAEEWGEDGYGLWMALRHAGARQVFRFIPPGTFLMGSPDSEPERWHGEGPRHPVTLTRGYWLADTACTQALWRVVTGNNPSRFQDDERNPVERVSFDEVQGFIDALNGRVVGLAARLPTEAEWEYACRAGTETPFSFGGNITPEQVNYDGNFPYAGGRKDLYREKTVPVGSLPANNWGPMRCMGTYGSGARIGSVTIPWDRWPTLPVPRRAPAAWCAAARGATSAGACVLPSGAGTCPATASTSWVSGWP